VIDPAEVKLQHEGFQWREILVRLPIDATLQDLNEPTLWRLVQGDPRKALCRLDRVAIIDHGETWLAEAVVSGATGQGVTLAGVKKTDLPPRTEVLLETEDYRTAFVGSGYATLRKKDGQIMTPVTLSKAAAERDHRNLIPTKSR
jgi:hypothetical protein